MVAVGQDNIVLVVVAPVVLIVLLERIKQVVLLLERPVFHVARAVAPLQQARLHPPRVIIPFVPLVNIKLIACLLASHVP